MLEIEAYYTRRDRNLQVHLVLDDYTIEMLSRKDGDK
jgi:hypothetical protein